MLYLLRFVRFFCSTPCNPVSYGKVPHPDKNYTWLFDNGLYINRVHGTLNI